MREYDLFLRDSAKDNWPAEPILTIDDEDRKQFEKANWKLGWTKYRYVLRNQQQNANPRSGCDSSTGQTPNVGTVRV